MTDYDLERRDSAFSLVKNILQRVSFEAVFYVTKQEDGKIMIVFRFLDLKNLETLEAYLKELSLRCEKEGYKRNHIVEALEKVSPFCLSFEFRPQKDALAYILHCIMENFLYTPEEEIEVCLHMIRNDVAKLREV